MNMNELRKMQSRTSSYSSSLFKTLKWVRNCSGVTQKVSHFWVSKDQRATVPPGSRLHFPVKSSRVGLAQRAGVFYFGMLEMNTLSAEETSSPGRGVLLPA